MIAAAGKFSDAAAAGGTPHWLTLWGSPGTGKTFLATAVYDWLRLLPRFRATADTPGPRMVRWAELMDDFQAKKDITSRFEALRRSPLVFIDDIGAEHVTSATLAKLSSIADARLGKWTILTSNTGPNQWHEMDARIASRMHRGASVVLECSTKDFSAR